jgi:hypothetical protein
LNACIYYDLDLIFGGLYVSDGSGDEDFLIHTTPAPHQNDNCLQSQKKASNAALEHEVGYLSNLWSNPSR